MIKKLFLVFIASGLLGITSASAEEKFFEIKAQKFFYTPNIITVNKGDTVRIRLISTDVHHGLYLDGYDIKTFAHPGQEGSLTFVADKTGRFAFRCAITCGEFHPYMVGYLIINPNSKFYFYVSLTLLIAAISLYFLFRRRKTESAQG